MASPQLEDGYTRIANTLMDALIRSNLPGVELRCAMAVIRITYGWNRKEADCSYCEIARMTGTTRRNATRAMNSLVEKRVLIKASGVKQDTGVVSNTTPGVKQDTTSENDGLVNTWKINKNFDKWTLGTSNRGGARGGVKQDTPPGVKQDTTCRPLALAVSRFPDPLKTEYKDKEEEYIPASLATCRQRDEIVEFSLAFHKTVSAEFPTQLPERKLTWQKVYDGADVLEKIVRLDGLSLAKVKDALRWAWRDEFWQSQIFSLAQLRKKSGRNGQTKFQNLLAAYERKGGDRKLTVVGRSNLAVAQRLMEE